MKLYQLEKSKLVSTKVKPFKAEKEIQNLVEANLDVLFNLEFVQTEFPVKSFRIDTLAFDRETKGFVVIEYKNTKSFSVIDQGYSYLSLLLNNKTEFIVEYNESCKDNLKRSDVDWSQSRVIFISPLFTEYQKHSINFKDVPFELWEIKQYEGGQVGFVQHKSNSNESISNISKNPEDMVNQVSREVKVYTEEYHFNRNIKRKDYVADLYESLKERILRLGDDIDIVPRKEYVAFKRGSNFVDVIFYTDHLKCTINMKKGTLNDPNSLCYDLSNQGHWGNGDYEFRLNQDTDMDYAMFLVKQSYSSKG